MTLYEINAEIASLVDEETGELLDYDRFADLQMERDAKIENMALWVKDLDAEAAAIKAEETALAERRKRRMSFSYNAFNSASISSIVVLSTTIIS